MVLRQQTNSTYQNSEITVTAVAQTPCMGDGQNRTESLRGDDPLFISLTPGGDPRRVVTVVQKHPILDNDLDINSWVVTMEQVPSG